MFREKYICFYTNTRRPLADYAVLLPSFICVYTATLNLVYYERAASGVPNPDQPCLSLFTFEYFAPCITLTLLHNFYSVMMEHMGITKAF